MIDLLNNDLSKVTIPFHEVKIFMKSVEEGLVNSDNQDFYKYLNETESFDELFKNLEN